LEHSKHKASSDASSSTEWRYDLSKSTAIKKTADGSTYLDPRQFHEYFAADLSAERAAFRARSQVLNAAENFRALRRTLLRNTSQKPQGRSLRRQPLGLCVQAEGGWSSYRRSCGARSAENFVARIALNSNRRGQLGSAASWSESTDANPQKKALAPQY